MTTTPTLWRAGQGANTTNSGPGGDDQFDQQIVGLADGSFVVLWTDNSDGGVGGSAGATGTDIVGQRYDVEGDKVGGEFRANAIFVGDDQGEFTAAALPDGGFVVVYEDTDLNGTSIRFTKWNATASTPTNGTILADPGVDTLNSPSVSVNDDGSFLVGFQQINEAGTDMTIRFVPVSSTLVVGSPLNVFSGAVPPSNFFPPIPQVDSAVLTEGRTVILSRTDPTDQAGAQDQLIFRLVTAEGAVGFSPSVVADTATNGATDDAPSVAALTDGGFVVAWQNTDASDVDVLFQRFDEAGNEVRGITEVNSTGGDDFNARPEVIGLSDGGFVIVYDDQAAAIKLQRYAANGAEVGAEVTVARSLEEEVFSDRRPTVTLSDDGRRPARQRHQWRQYDRDDHLAHRRRDRQRQWRRRHPPRPGRGRHPDRRRRQGHDERPRRQRYLRLPCGRRRGGRRIHRWRAWCRYAERPWRYRLSACGNNQHRKDQIHQ